MQLRRTFPLNFSLASVASFNFYGKSVGERSRSVFKQGRVALIKTFSFFFVVETTKCYRYKWILVQFDLVVNRLIVASFDDKSVE